MDEAPASEQRESAPQERPSTADLNSPEALAAATARLKALGVDQDVVFIALTPEEVFAYLDADDPSCADPTCAPSS